MDKIPSFEFTAALTGESWQIVTNNALTIRSEKPARRHRKKRIAKKWLKRYGYGRAPDPNVYVIEGRRIMMHPAIFKRFAKALGTPEEAAESIIKNIGG